jgi:hypothetical protein
VPQPVPPQRFAEEAEAVDQVLMQDAHLARCLLVAVLDRLTQLGKSGEYLRAQRVLPNTQRALRSRARRSAKPVS